MTTQETIEAVIAAAGEAVASLWQAAGTKRPDLVDLWKGLVETDLPLRLAQLRHGFHDWDQVSETLRREPSEARRLMLLLGMTLPVERRAKGAFLAGLRDPDALVRLLAVMCLKAFTGEEVELALLAALEDPDPEVSGNAAVALYATRPAQAMEHLIKRLADRERRAETAVVLRKLTGKHFLFGATDSKKWRKWWAQHQPAGAQK